MNMITSDETRKIFIEYFKSKNHTFIEPSTIVVKNDPTLLFTNSGMNQFKDIFLNNKTATHNRVANYQNCLRVSGKHNDLEEVGVDTYHHTMFEMLGNWSFGDYSKKDAIFYAWELLTEIYKIPKDKLYVTVFEGDDKDKTSFDDETYNIWKEYVSEDNIIRGNKKDNFWEMGETGPCGPCTEIHIDIRTNEVEDIGKISTEMCEDVLELSGRELVNNNHPQVIELWNIVFIEYERTQTGDLIPLENKHIDTGMGFERLCMVLQGKNSNYDTDIFDRLIDFICSYNSITYYRTRTKKDITIRIIADHIRAIVFAINDGVIPSNKNEGYVIRKIIRRAVRYYNTYLAIDHPFLHKMVYLIFEQFKDVYLLPIDNIVKIEKILYNEELNFLKTLKVGLKKINAELDKNPKIISGEFAFKLSDTFGFPLDVLKEICFERNIPLDEATYNILLNQQKERSNNKLK